MNAVATPQGPTTGWTIAQWLSAYREGGATPDALLMPLAETPAAPADNAWITRVSPCLLYTSPSPRDQRGSRMPSSA